MSDVSKTTGTEPGDAPQVSEGVKQGLRLLRLAMGAIALFVLFKAWQLLMAGQLPVSTAFIAGTFGVLGLSALVEAIWPDGDLGLIHFWMLTAVGATGVAAWAGGGKPWMGALGIFGLILSFAFAVKDAADGSKRHNNAR
jgi:hypothetical protein